MPTYESKRMRIALVPAAALALVATLTVDMRRVDNHCLAHGEENRTRQVSKPTDVLPEAVDENRMDLAMAWKRLCNEFPEKEHDKLITVTPRSAERFAGFVEGATGVKLPGWWEQALFGARGYSKNGVRLERPKSWPYQERDLKEGPIPLDEMILQRDVIRSPVENRLVVRTSGTGDCA